MVLDMLTGQKYLCHLYNQAVLATNRSSVRDTLQHILHEEQQIAFRLSKAMEQLHRREQSMVNPTDTAVPRSGARRQTQVHTVEAALQKSAQRERRAYDTPPWDLM